MAHKPDEVLKSAPKDGFAMERVLDGHRQARTAGPYDEMTYEEYYADASDQRNLSSPSDLTAEATPEGYDTRDTEAEEGS